VSTLAAIVDRAGGTVRKFILVLVGIVLSVGTLAACVGGPPPPPPTDPHDVLVVGDSIAFSYGCVLGSTEPGCPANPGYTTQSNYLGACTISQGTTLLYNSWTVDQPNCHNWQSVWQAWADFYVPKVVVINTGGWEIVDRWTPDVGGLPGGCDPANAFNCPPPDFQWGGSVNGSQYNQAKGWYTYNLYLAINMFKSRGAKVVVANALDAAGDRPVPDEFPDPCPANPITCHAYWEPYGAQPVAGQPNPHTDQQPTPNYTASWDKPNNGLSYRQSKVKVDQFNDSIQWLKDNFFATDNNVVVFNARKHFSPAGQYKDHVCPPPNDSTEVPQWNGTAYVCSGSVPAILARAADHGHLSSAGQLQVLKPYLEPCVKALIPVAGGDLSKCT
jgi:hypothetical protein